MTGREYDSVSEANLETSGRICNESSQYGNFASSQLPVKIWEQIFLYFPRRNLLSLVTVSSEIRWIIAKHIYTRIIIDDEDSVSWMQDHGDQRPHQGTMMIDKHLPKLLQTVRDNPRLAAFVTALISNSVHNTRAHTCEELMLHLPNLVEWHDKSFLRPK